jgi:hypothetical protein
MVSQQMAITGYAPRRAGFLNNRQRMAPVTPRYAHAAAPPATNLVSFARCCPESRAMWGCSVRQDYVPAAKKRTSSGRSTCWCKTCGVPPPQYRRCRWAMRPQGVAQASTHLAAQVAVLTGS